MNRGHRCNPQSQDDRLRQFHSRLGLTPEELLPIQAQGLRVRAAMVDRAFQIPRHRSLVVVEQPKRKRRARG